MSGGPIAVPEPRGFGMLRAQPIGRRLYVKPLAECENQPDSDSDEDNSRECSERTEAGCADAHLVNGEPQHREAEEAERQRECVKPSGA